MDTVTESGMAIAMAVSEPYKMKYIIKLKKKYYISELWYILRFRGWCVPLTSLFVSLGRTYCVKCEMFIVWSLAHRGDRLHPPQLHARIPGQRSEKGQGNSLLSFHLLTPSCVSVLHASFVSERRAGR